MARITKSGGKLIIIDKNEEKLGRFEIGDWEQWFNENELKEIMLNFCKCVYIEKEIPYEGISADGLFYAWIGEVK